MKTVKIRKCKCIPPPWYAATVEIPTKHSIWIGPMDSRISRLVIKAHPNCRTHKACEMYSSTRNSTEHTGKLYAKQMWRVLNLPNCTSLPVPERRSVALKLIYLGVGGFWGEVPPCMPICYKYKSIFNAYTLIMAYMSRQCKVIDQIWSIKL